MDLANRLTSFVDLVSFSTEVRNLVDTLNQEIASAEHVAPRIKSHPAGFAKEITKRRLTIAESYLRLVTFTGIDHYRERLDALQTLIHQAWHSKTLSMPINTARVQVTLMKECVKARVDKRRQLELMSDFALASHGQQNVIRRLLRELDMIEVPEDGRALSDMDLGWDDHVHDFLTEGRKTPCQLLLDAFIKGISRLTVAYYDLHDARIFEEALEAGRLLGIQVEIGIEFSVGKKSERLHFMFIPPGSDSVTGLQGFLATRHEVLAPFFAGLDTNSEGRRRTISSLLEAFNTSHLKDLNARFRNLPFLMVEPLHWVDMEKFIHHGQASRIHLGQLLLQRIQPILHKRVLYLKNQYLHARDKLNNGETSTWEVDNLKAQYMEVRSEYESCTARSLLDRYMASREGVDYDSAFSRFEDVLPLLSSCGGRIVFIHPLSQGPETAVRTLLNAHEWITDVETFNLADSQSRDPADLRRLSTLVGLLNTGRQREIASLLADWGMTSATPGQVAAACEGCVAHPLVPRCGSDYDGRDARVPGMGFIKACRLPKRFVLKWKKKPYQSLAAPIGRLLLQQGLPDRPLDEGKQILVLERPVAMVRNRVGDEGSSFHIGLFRFWRYLNLNIKSLAKISFAFLPAFFLTDALFPSAYAVGIGYILLWFGITGFRNIMADLVSAAGLSARSWRMGSVDRDNLANSIFWTGFSVPILGLTKWGFDTLWPLVGSEESFFQVLSKFCVLALANGLYLSAHNRLRGFDATVVRANFFRTVLSWPLATAGSYALDLLAIPAIVQTKIWSDVVAGLIEGTGKARRRLRLCRRDFFELLRTLLQRDRQTQLVAVADILFIWARRFQGRSTLTQILADIARSAPADEPLDDAGKRLNRAQIVEAVGILRGIMIAEGSMEDLTSLILEHYSGREAVILSSLIADHHLAFQQWIRHTAIPLATSSNAAA